jgi:pimeloyl-ACP methyl ester carboxylesterase
MTDQEEFHASPSVPADTWSAGTRRGARWPVRYWRMVDGDGRPVMRGGIAVYPPRHTDGIRVVVVHGTMDRGASFIKVMRRLPELSIIRYDRRGYGRSIDAGAARSFSDHVDDLVMVLDGRPAVVVGHSLGGLIALAAGEQHPELVPAIAAFEAPMPWASWWPRRSAGGDAVLAGDEDGGGVAAERFMRRMIGDRRWDALPAATRDARRREGPALLSDLHGVRREEAPYDLARIRQPIVAGRGTASDAHHQRAAEVLAGTAIDGELVTIEGADHGAHFSHPAEFAAFVQRTVDRSGGSVAVAD